MIVHLYLSVARLVCACVPALWLLPAVVAAQSQSYPLLQYADLAESPWEVLKIRKQRPTKFVLDNHVLSVSSKNSVAFLYHKIKRPAPGQSLRLRWSWRILEAPAPSALSIKSEDDRPLALHIWFMDEEEAKKRTSWFKRSMATLFSVPVPGNMLTYSWGGIEAVGSEFINPYMPEHAYIQVLRNSDEKGGHWYEQDINVSAQFRRLFNKEIDSDVYVVISADTDNQRGYSHGQVKQLEYYLSPNNGPP